MKKVLTIISSLLIAGSVLAEVTDVYKLTMSVKVPRIYDNMQSLGSRKYQTQKITGYLNITYPESEAEGTSPTISITGLVNKTHKYNGSNVTYETEMDDSYPTFVNYIGSNKTKEFKVSTICFGIIAEPVYAIGEPDEDNSLLCMLSGKGNSKVLKSGAQIVKSLSGTLTGTLGCGCKEYGHVSPTRVAGKCGPTDQVMDRAAVCGTWSATYYGSCGRTSCSCK